MYLFFLNLQSCVFGNMRCSVYGCHSDNQAKKNPCRDIKFYHFPKDETMAKKWLYATGRKDPVNLKNACICSKHFLESDFKLNLKHQLLNYTPKNFRGLKEDAVPVANLPFSRKEPLQTDTKSSTKKRLQKRMVTELLNKNCTMSNRLCSVKDCEDRQSKRHQFPDVKVDPILFKKWVDACGNKELVTLDPAMIRRNKKVCHKHFTGDFLMANGRISRIAYPTIFLPHSEKQDDRLVMESPESSSNSPQYKIEVLDFSERPQVLLQDERFMESLEALSTSPRYKVDVVKEEIAEDFSADDSIMTSQPTSPQCKIEIVEEDIFETEEGFSKRLGKCTRRGSKKCPKCGKLNGTKSLICKNNQCGVVLRVSEEKCKVDLDAIKLNTGTVRQVYSVRVRDVGPDHRGFVQLPLTNRRIDEDNAVPTVALCFVDSCQRLFDDSILKCHEEDAISNGGNLFCQHIKAALRSVNMATTINIKNEALHLLKVSDDVKMKLLLLATETESPLVQRVSTHVMAVKCQVSPKHPLGYLHFTFANSKGKDIYDKYYCTCAEFLFSSNIRDKASNIRYKCTHYYACVWALSSNTECLEEFACFLNYGIPMPKPTTINIIPENKELLKESIQPKEPTPDILNKRKRHSNSSKKKKCKLLMPNILPIQIKILDSSDNDKEKSLSAWEFVDWLSYVTESINKTMQFENCGLLNTQIFHIPETFYKCLKSKIPAIYLANPVNGMVNGEFFHIMNILHVKEIFDTPKVKLRLSKKFIHSDTIGFVEDEKNESIPENFQTSFIFFLNVGQSTIDESDNTNNSFFIEWIPDITECTRVGQLKLQYKYGRKSTCILTTE